MADGKLTYDVEFNAHTESLAAAIARAVDAGTRKVVNENLVTRYDTALAGLAARQGRSESGLAAAVMSRLDDGVSSNIAEFALLASETGYQPSTIQGAINSAVAAAMRKSKKKPDWEYKLDAQQATNELRAIQRENRASDLAETYWNQGELFASLAAQASTPEAQRLLLSRAASRYGSVTSRTIMEAKGIDPYTAAQALEISANLAAIRSEIKTSSQLYNEENRQSALVASEIANNTVAGIRNIQDSWKWAAGQFKAENVAASIKAAQEDVAWASRDYDARQKARDMEKGFRAMEAASATEEIYNPDRDPAVARWGFGASISAASRYATEAGKHPFGSIQRRTNVAMAQQALRGVSVDAMSKSGMTQSELKTNTEALIEVNDTLKGLLTGPGGGGTSPLNNIVTGAVAKTVASITGLVTDVMGMRTEYLADTRTPYQTRRSVYQSAAQKYGSASIVPGAAIGAKAGAFIGAKAGATLGPVGAVAGAIIGALPGAVSWIAGKHFEDEKKIGDAQQARAIDMNRYRNLYGDRVEYNYAQLVENLGYAPASAIMGMAESSAMLPGAMMFGGVSEQQMVGLSYMPNYWAALWEGRPVSEQLEAARMDMANLPESMVPYVWKMVGGSEDVRAFLGSSSFGVAQSLSGELRNYDRYQYARNRMWEGGRQIIAAQNVSESVRNYASELTGAKSPNAVKNGREAAMTVFNSLANTRRILGANEAAEAFSSLPDFARYLERGGQTGEYGDRPLGNIVIQIDGSTVYEKPFYKNDFVESQQTFILGNIGG